MLNSGLLTIGARGFSIAASSGLAVVVARTLGADQAGAFFACLALVGTIGTLGRWGTDNLALTLLAGGPGVTVAKDTRALLLVCFMSSILVSACLLGLAPALARSLGAITVLHLWLVAAIIPLACVSVTSSAVLRARGRPAAGTFAELGAVPAIAMLVILLYSSRLTIDLNQSLVALLSAQAVTTVTSTAAALRVSRATSPREPLGTRAARHLWRTQRPTLTAMMGTSLLFYLLIAGPPLMLTAVSDAEETAKFAVAARLAGFVLLLPAIQTAYLAPNFAALAHQRDMGGLQALCRVSTRQVIVPALTGAALLVLFPEACLAVFGPEFVSAQAALRVLAFTGVVVVASGQVNALLLTTGMERTGLLLTCVALSLATPVLAFASAHYGATGAAVVYGVTTATYATTGSWVLARRLGIGSGLVKLNVWGYGQR